MENQYPRSRHEEVVLAIEILGQIGRSEDHIRSRVGQRCCRLSVEVNHPILDKIVLLLGNRDAGNLISVAQHFGRGKMDVGPFTKIMHRHKPEIGTGPRHRIKRYCPEDLSDRKAEINSGSEAVVIHQGEITEHTHEIARAVEIHQTELMSELVRHDGVERGRPVVLAGRFGHDQSGPNDGRVVVYSD